MNRTFQMPFFKRVLPAGYGWQDELREEKEEIDGGHQVKDGTPIVTRHTLVFAMPKPSDWDDLDVEMKMKRKRRECLVHGGPPC